MSCPRDRPGITLSVNEAMHEAHTPTCPELLAEAVTQRDEEADLSGALTADDDAAEAVLERLAFERRALDELTIEAPRLTGSEIRLRLNAMNARLSALDAHCTDREYRGRDHGADREQVGASKQFEKRALEQTRLMLCERLGADAVRDLARE
jgi:hypothetical protein